MRRAAAAVGSVLAAALGSAMVLAQVAPERFTATASVKRGEASALAPLAVTITRYASSAERDAVVAAIRDGGSAAARTVLAAMTDAGFIQVGEHRTAIKFAAQRPTASGRLVTLVTATPILFLGAAVPQAKSQAGFDVAVAILDLGDGQTVGELAPAAKLGLDESGALLIEDYGATVVWLNGLVRAK